MRCPYCGQDNDKVIDSRATEDGKAIRRRRECLGCSRRFTTYERVEQNVRLTVIKKDGRRVPFDREKILAGVQKACYKRPIPAEAIQKLVDEVEEEIQKRGGREIESVEIGRMVAERLRRLDQVAYVRFASVYRQFRDLDELLDEVRQMLSQPPSDVPGQGRLF